MECSDEDLIEAYYAGNGEAFGKLYERYYCELFMYFNKFVPQEEAEDLAEETFFQVVRTEVTGMGRFDRSRGCFKPWLYSIAHNMLCNMLKNHLRRQQHEVRFEEIETIEEGEGEESVVEQFPAEEPSPEELLEAQELSEPVKECLNELPPELREVLILAYIEGLELREIAEMLGITYGTAGRRLHQARQQMRRCLEGKGYCFIPRGIELPPGAQIVMTFRDELLIRL